VNRIVPKVVDDVVSICKICSTHINGVNEIAKAIIFAIIPDADYLREVIMTSCNKIAQFKFSVREHFSLAP